MLGWCWRVDLAAWCIALWVLSDSAIASAQSQASPADDLSIARATFAAALGDEEALHFSEALEKFQQVRAVRDTAPVEYRIGTCHEALGQAVAAHSAYRRAIALGLADARSAEVIAAAIERLGVLEKHLASLKLAMADGAPADAEIRVDERLVPQADLREPVVVAPGLHVVTAVAREDRPFRIEVVLAEGTRVTLPIALERRADIATTVDRAPTAAGRPGRETSAAEEPSSAKRTLGWVVFGGGSALLVGSVGTWLARNGDIGTLHRDCPGDVCPPGSDRAALESIRSRALFEGPLAIALGAGGLAAFGSGAFLLLVSNGASSSRRPLRGGLIPLVANGSTGIALAGDF